MTGRLHCWDRYRKDELVKYVASLFVMKQNSSQTQKLSSLMMYVLMSKGGREHLSIPRFKKDLEYCSPFLDTDDPQEYLFIDCVHTPEGTFRVFPGYFANLHGNLTRLFCVAEAKNVVMRKLGEVYALLELSDIVAQRAGLKRYERGDETQERLSILSFKETLASTNSITFTHREVARVCEKYKVRCCDGKRFVIRPHARIISQALAEGNVFSLIDKAPLYHTSQDEYVVLQPFSLQACSYLRCLEILRQELGEESLYNMYIEVLMADVHRSIKLGDNMLVDKKVFGNTGCLIYRIDDDKFARICCTGQQGVKAEDKKKADEYVKAKYSAKGILNVTVSNPLEIDMMTFGDGDDILTSAEDFELMMKQDGMHLLDLYYYFQSRQNLPMVFGSQEIDMFSYYWLHGRTFYQDKTYTHYNFGPDWTFDMRCQYLQGKDYHIIDGLKHKIMIAHSNDMPKVIPVYEPMGRTQHPILIGEYIGSIVTFFYDNSKKDEEYALRETAKSILVWMYAYEKRHEEPLLKDGQYTILLSFNDSQPKVGDGGDYSLIYEMPRSFFSHEVKEGTHEQTIFDFLIGALAHFGYVEDDEWKVKVAQLFAECHGQHMQIQPDGQDFWLVHDKYDRTYTVDSHESDVALDAIADHLNRRGKEVNLDFKQSEELVKDIIEFLGTELNKMLKEIASQKFVEELIKLHHGTLFWLSLTEVRFEKVNELYDYLGADYSEQVRLMNEYSETNNLTMCLIERIVSNGYCNEDNIPSIETINKVYAYMHHLYSFGIYLDYIKAKVKGMEFSILENGRVAVPKKTIDKTQRYFYDLRNSEMYHREAYRRIQTLENGTNIDYDAPAFLDAFLDEYGITFQEWLDVMRKCVNYSFDHQEPVVNLGEEQFESEILKSSMLKEHIGGFKDSFLLHQGMVRKDIPLHESFMQRFNRMYQMSSRPWVKYHGRILYSVKSLHYHQKVMLTRLDDGKMKAYSAKMKSFKGKINEKKGDNFNNLLCELYKGFGNPNLTVDKEVKVGLKERIIADEPLGDFDVLVINHEQKKIVCIEAKDYIECRTVYELLLEEKKVRDDLEMVIKRDEWAKSHVDSFKTIDKNVTADYQVITAFVTSHIPAHVYLGTDEDSSIKFFSAIELAENPMVIMED